MEHVLGRRRDLDEREPAHECVRHLEQEVLVEDVHRRHDPPTRRHPDRLGVLGRLDAVGHDRQGLALAGAFERQHDRLAGQHGEQLAEGAVEVRPVELVDHEPLTGLDRLDEQARTVDEPLGCGLEATDGLERRPLGGRRGREVAGAEHRLFAHVGRQVGEGRLARARRAGEHARVFRRRWQLRADRAHGRGRPCRARRRPWPARRR